MSIFKSIPVALYLAVAAPLWAQEDHSHHQVPPQEPASSGHGHHSHGADSSDAAAEPNPALPENHNHGASGHEMPEVEGHDHGAMEHDTSTPEQHAHPEAGHDVLAVEEHDHAAMGHDQGPSVEPRQPIPVLTDADRAAAFPKVGGHAVHDHGIHHFLQFNRLEGWDADEGTALAWEGRYWGGSDLNRLWFRSEGERVDDHTESADLEVLYGRSIARWWDLMAGVRQDLGSGPSQTFAAIGVQGVAPYQFEIEATAYFGESGQTAARLEAEYELLLTNRLIMQPLVELSLYGKDDAQRGIGAGLSTLETGLRLRYEFTRRFAPYLGVIYERAFSGTADLRRAVGENIDDTQVIAGVRFWF